MKIIKLYHAAGTAKLRVDTLDDLWTVQRIIFTDDIVKSRSERKFKASESDTGELKEVVITLKVEKTELDKDAMRLRVMGKIVEGRPLEYVKLNSYHTLNIAPGDEFELTKAEWPKYVLDVLKNAVSDTSKPRLGLIVVDDEKALPAYLLGYGVEFRNEIYSRLSKRMSSKDFDEQQKKYYGAIVSMVRDMQVDTVIVAGPGFTKDDIKTYIDSNESLKKTPKRLIFAAVSNAERSGIYELIRSDHVARLLERERIRMEFKLMEIFLTELSSGASKYGVGNVDAALDNLEANAVLVNDNVLGDRDVQQVLSKAERQGVRIEVFNSADEVGMQLQGFKNIASVQHAE